VTFPPHPHTPNIFSSVLDDLQKMAFERSGGTVPPVPPPPPWRRPCPQPPEAIEGLRAKAGGKGIWEWSPSNFSIKVAHFYAYFGQNSYFKAINLKSI